jgi:hypothetical protein
MHAQAEEATMSKGIGDFLEVFGIPGWIGEATLGAATAASLVWGFYHRAKAKWLEFRHHDLGIDHNKLVVNGGPVISDGKYGRRTACELPNIGMYFTPKQLELLKASVIPDGLLKAYVQIPDAKQRGPIWATLQNIQNQFNSPAYSGLMAGVHAGSAEFMCALTLESHTDTPAGVLEKFRLEMITVKKARELHEGGLKPVEPKLATNMKLLAAGAAEALMDTPRSHEIFWKISLPVA